MYALETNDVQVHWTGNTHVYNSKTCLQSTQGKQCVRIGDTGTWPLARYTLSS